MIAQQARNNVFVRGQVSQDKVLANPIWAKVDKSYNSKTKCVNMIEITLLGRVQGCDVLVFNQVYLNIGCFSFFLPSQITCPIFVVVIHLYSPSHLHLNLPLVGFLRNCLDACPIWTSWKLCEEILARTTLFRCHIFINVVSSFGAVHLMWWWQSSSQIFLLLLLAQIYHFP